MTPLTLSQARVLMALVAVHARDGRADLPAVMEAVGRNRSTCWTHLRRLERMGLVAWDARGGLCPLAAWVPVEPVFGATLGGNREVAGRCANSPGRGRDLAGGPDVANATHPPRQMHAGGA